MNMPNMFCVIIVTVVQVLPKSEILKHGALEQSKEEVIIQVEGHSHDVEVLLFPLLVLNIGAAWVTFIMTIHSSSAPIYILTA